MRVLQACEAHGVQALLTRDDHPSGSDRLAEAVTLLNLSDDAIVVYVQGDEPLIDPASPAVIARRCWPPRRRPAHVHRRPSDHRLGRRNPNVVKVVCDAQQLAPGFQPRTIPWRRDGDADGDIPAVLSARAAAAAPYRHLRLSRRLPAPVPGRYPGPIETCESLEQLARRSWHGHRIAMHITPDVPVPVSIRRKTWSARGALLAG